VTRRGKPVTIAFFDAKPYDREFFNAANARHRYDIRYFENRLTQETAALADRICDLLKDPARRHEIARAGRVEAKAAGNGN
jgi:D-lactate dehydrogenase